MVKNGWGLIDHGTHKPSVSHKWFDELSRLTEWFLHADSDGIIFFSTLYLWNLNAGGPLQLYLATALGEIPLAQKWPQARVFLLFWQILYIDFCRKLMQIKIGVVYSST